MHAFNACRKPRSYLLGLFDSSLQRSGMCHRHMESLKDIKNPVWGTCGSHFGQIKPPRVDFGWILGHFGSIFEWFLTSRIKLRIEFRVRHGNPTCFVNFLNFGSPGSYASLLALFAARILFGHMRDRNRHSAK